MRLLLPLRPWAAWSVRGPAYNSSAPSASAGLGPPAPFPAKRRPVQKAFQKAAQSLGDHPTEIDWDLAMAVIREAETRFPNPTATPQEKARLTDQSFTFNLAKLADDHHGLRALIDLGVNVAQWERNGQTDIALKLDFVRHVQPKVKFYLQQGVSRPDIPDIFTANPLMMEDDVNDWQIRVDYLKTMQFTPAMIRTILSGNPWWFNYKVQEIDGRLGFLQKTYNLNGPQIRAMVVQCPRLVTWGGIPGQIIYNNLALVEEMGFTQGELRAMVRRCPKLVYVKYQDQLRDSFNVLHNEVGYPHKLLVRFPETMLVPHMKLKERFEFLRLIKQDQYSPEEPNFVSPVVFAQSSDLELCQRFKVNIDQFNRFLKTL
ncbi:hypothetical protein TCAL_01179 [Tigriopus californicus]|uniref:mTERF domain-containing protein 1, mitochondrial n=1 Tax=Tigriopus californicus TaxID=6832 RepID=A0A553P055_TIGCA|nr:transcription termination factor 3, mitochondrial-like [Tigriopus californicus]TRY71071.1 hypothetical protein TCAL_01179 [Tigriopus californicus]|eukprot:TCALIF_01179-PA protein Name:"Similar to Mterfd1 mTERF domain-containing protein 1, mitochondrial (Mus musculus)" AED:0.13 eAED:0.13 QI:0/-1/0/1/-1/1/1/0/372